MTQLSKSAEVLETELAQAVTTIDVILKALGWDGELESLKAAGPEIVDFVREALARVWGEGADGAASAAYYCVDEVNPYVAPSD